MKTGDIRYPRVKSFGQNIPRTSIDLRRQGAPGFGGPPIGGIGDYRMFMVGPGDQVARTVGAQKRLVDILCSSIEETHPTAKVHLIRRAGYIAAEAFDGKTRNSGLPYFSHLYDVVLLLNTLGLERVKTIAAGFLHDHLEDIDRSKGRKERLIAALSRSGELADMADAMDVVTIVENVTNLQSVKDSDEETIAHLIDVATVDIRPVILKLADRLHNQEDWQAVREKTRIHKSTETRNIYAPFAFRLGLYNWSRRLFDTTIRDLEPKTYMRLCAQRDELSRALSTQLQIARQELAQMLEPFGARILPTPRSLWDTIRFSAERREGTPQVQPIDLSSFAIILPDGKDEIVFSAFAQLCRRYSLVTGSVEDAVNNPRSDFYRAFISSFRTPHGIIRIQLQTESMYDRGIRGVASESGNRDWFKGGTMFARYALTLAEELGVPRTRLQEVFGRAANSILIRTPKGKWVELSRLADGSTPTIIDFAAIIHSDLPAKITSALMDGVAVPIDAPLKPFAEVSLIVGSTPQYDPERFKYAKTPRALKALKEAYSNIPKPEIVSGGRLLLDNFMSEYLLSTKDLGRLAIAQEFIRRFWRQNLPKHQRDAVLKARLGENWEDFLLEGEPVDHYGQKKGLRLTNGKIIKASFEDYYYLIGSGEIDPDSLGKLFIAFYAANLNRVLGKSGQTIPSFTYRIITMNVPGILQQLLSPWAKYGINIENESGGPVNGPGGANLSETRLTFSAYSQIMQLQIPRQMRLLGNLPSVLRIENIEVDAAGTTTSTLFFEKQD